MFHFTFFSEDQFAFLAGSACPQQASPTSTEKSGGLLPRTQFPSESFVLAASFSTPLNNISKPNLFSENEVCRGQTEYKRVFKIYNFLKLYRLFSCKDFYLKSSEIQALLNT